ncbi:MAG: metallophosphoesterase [Candidatus Tenebribacter davisii]|nr:metallophosphoesterase [Candidatus Tenebribacter davisii]
MKFIGAADIHITDRCPTNRKGDYFGQIMNKFEFILKTAMKTDSKVIVVAGDFFNSAKVKYEVTNRVLSLVQKYNDVRILAVPGQHDLHYHTGGLKNTPLGILETAKAVEILKPDSITEINGVTFMGCGWNEKPSVEADVLLMHLMITKKGELWSGQTNYSTAHAILRKYPWAKCILSGDNHAPHVLRLQNKKLQINCGAVPRSTKSQIGFQPRVHLIDSDDWTSKSIKIPCLPAEDVFDFNKIAVTELKDEAKKEAEAKIAEFISMLPKNQVDKPNFKTILSSVIAHANPKQDVRDIINNIMETI